MPFQAGGVAGVKTLSDLQIDVTRTGRPTTFTVSET